MVKVLSFRIQQFFSVLLMLLVEGSSEAELFRNLSNHVFWSPSVQKHVSYEGIFCLKMFKSESRFSKSKKIFGKCLFVSQIIASKDVGINCLY